MTTFTIEHTPADIVRLYPKSSDIFKRMRIDFCCGGDKPLSEVETKREIDKEALLLELNTGYKDWIAKGNQGTDWEQTSYTEIVDYIINRHHAYLADELPALGQFVTKIFRVHGGSHPHLVNLHRLYNRFKAEMEEHMIKEEQDLFPLIKQYEKNPGPKLLAKIQKINEDMEKEHDAAGDLLKMMHDVTGGFTLPEGACNSYRITYARLAELEEDTYQHVHLENNILFQKLA